MPYFLLALAPLFWAGNWIVGRAINESVTPLGLNLGRWLVASLILLILTAPRLRKIWPIMRKEWLRLFVLATCGTLAFHSLVYTGLKYTTAINAVLLNSITPIFVVCASMVLLSESLRWRQALGVAISFAGILVIVARGDLAVLATLEVNPGDALILLAMPFWAMYTVLIKRWKFSLSGLELLAAISFISVILLVPPFLLEFFAFGGEDTLVLDWNFFGAILYIGLFASVIAYLCWNRGITQVGANKAGFFIHLLPAYGAVMAILFLGEHAYVFHGLGIGLILAGVYLSTASRETADQGAPKLL